MADTQLSTAQLLVLQTYDNDLTTKAQVLAEEDPVLNLALELAGTANPGFGYASCIRRMREAKDAIDLQQARVITSSLTLVDALWWFIENVPLDARWRSDLFFELRARVMDPNPVRASVVFTVDDVADRFDGTEDEAEQWLHSVRNRLIDVMTSRGNDAIDDLLVADGKFKDF